ncbi:MAG: 16S rRNA (adenine(1518)-N(6)/adenine(1519)-N(6))-dimethyltransferase RsmA [Candidatus Falkowbacteria bacterium]
MSLLLQTQELCRQHGIIPARSKGQNFLIEENVYEAVVDAANLIKDDLVLEVGPGFGFLTARLAKRVKKVIAVELDSNLANFLKNFFVSQKIANVELIEADVLKLALNSSGLAKYKIVSNLPYNISSIFLRKFLTAEHKPESLTLLLQKEVAERIVAKPGEMSLLALSVQFYAEPKIVQIVPAKAFWPAPKIDSALISIIIKSEAPKVSEKSFFRLAKFGFSAKRKKLKNNLAGGLSIDAVLAGEYLTQIGLSADVRAEDLSLEHWLDLYQLLSAKKILG